MPVCASGGARKAGGLCVVAAGMAVVALCPALLAVPSAAAARTRPAHVSAAGAGGTWGKAEQVPGTAALNQGGHAVTLSVSCAAAGDCSAVGYSTPSASSVVAKAFVVTESGGRWGKAEEVLGSAAFNSSGATVDSVSCAAAGDCSAGGSAGQQAFVVNQTGGRWGKAEQVPGLAALNRAGLAQIVSVSCTAPGQCSAGGYYASRVSHGLLVTQPFVVSESGGTWGTAQAVRGAAAVNPGGAMVNSVSCAAAGDCSAGGTYASRAGQQAFVVNQTGGRWGTAEQVPGTAALNKGGGAAVGSVSCAAAGRCSAGGYYENGSLFMQPFVVNETGGTWGRAEQVPGTAALNKGGTAQVDSVSCAAAGTCSAGGDYSLDNGNTEAFVVNETGGRWGKAEQVPGTAALNKRGAETTSVSCAAAGQCSAGGYYLDGTGGQQAFVVNEAGGTWGKAEQVPGTAALNKGGFAQIVSVSCAAAGRCGAGGLYASGSVNGRPVTQAFIVSETTSDKAH